MKQTRFFTQKCFFGRVLFYNKIIFLVFCVSAFSIFSTSAQDLSTYYDSAQSYKNKDLEKQSFFTKKLLSESQKQKNKEYLLKAYHLTATIFYEKANKDSAFFYIDKALDLAEIMKNNETKIEVLRLKGFIYKNRVYNKDSALLFFQKALQESKRLDYKYGKIKNLEAISFLLMDKGNYLDATQLLLEAREIAHEIKDKKALSSIANNIGHTYLQMYMYEKALPFFNEANRHREDKTTASIIPLNIAECYYRTGNTKKALLILDKNTPLALKTSLNMAIEYHLEYVNLFLEIEEPKKALEKIKILDSLLLDSKPQAYRNLLLLKAKTHLQLKDTLTAHNYAKEVEKKISIESNDDFINRMTMHELFSYTYMFLKDYQKANYHSQKYLSLYKNTYNKKLEQDIYQKEVDQRIFLQKKENELEKLKYITELEKEQQNKRYFLLVLIALLIIFIVIIRAYWINKKYSIELKNTNYKLSESQSEIIQQNHTLHEQAEELTRQSEELKSSHEELVTMNDNLEYIVNQRNQEVIEKNKMLEEYAFINAHKLRAPVARLLGIMQIIELSKDTSEIEFYLQICNKEIKDLDRIIWAIKEAIEEKTPLDRWELEKRKEMK
ncbi:tetratricopeptide repeat protein [Bernardetia sp. Wsw4-3y2]|uniref:tetratricopeptide repeat protein n=1 Tax=Bernardetia sp. Wsw4-3y2 TaxID=3127471 RepID=UPI0030D08D13